VCTSTIGLATAASSSSHDAAQLSFLNRNPVVFGCSLLSGFGASRARRSMSHKAYRLGLPCRCRQLTRFLVQLPQRSPDSRAWDSSLQIGAAAADAHHQGT
jgi:hypothetical protein